MSSVLDGSAAVCMPGGHPVEFPGAVYSPSSGVSWTGSRTQLRLREDLGIEQLPHDWACVGAGPQLSCQVEFHFPRRDEASQKRAALALRSGGLEAAKAELTTKVIRRIEWRGLPALILRNGAGRFDGYNKPFLVWCIEVDYSSNCFSGESWHLSWRWIRSRKLRRTIVFHIRRNAVKMNVRSVASAFV